MMEKLRLLYILVISFLLGAPGLAQSLDVTASTDSSDYLLGDYINYTLELRYDEGVQPVFNFQPDSLKELTFIENGKFENYESDGKTVELFRYVYSYYDSADVTIPAVEIPYTVQGRDDTLYAASNTVDVAIRKLEIDMQNQKPHDVKAPFTIPLDWWFILLIVLILLALVVASYFAYRYYKRKRGGKVEVKKIVVLPPHVTALNKLKELEAQKLWQQGEVKEYHSEITQIIRGYYEERFNILALEMTSGEILEQLEKIDDANEVYEATRSFLSNADLVKFAKFQPMPVVNEEMMKQAYEIVETTREPDLKEEEKKLAEELKNA